jgi:nitronate monooxygenase/enoyl-[acyl-carrier protein] reductase II
MRLYAERPVGARAASDRLREMVRTAAADGRLHELLPFTGQSAGLVHNAPAAVVIDRIQAEAAPALRSAPTAGRPTRGC